MMQETEEGIELSESLVLTRTRAPDLDSVKKLNCWASNISDVQVVRRMPNLEVCSLSINSITSLRDFAHCHKLKELYVRTNNIQHLSDVHYLKRLPRLRSLWLSENPCANTPNYRPTVLKSLPNLQKLDNKAVTPEEVEAAEVEGDEIPIPDDISFSSLFTSPLDDTQSSVNSSSLKSSLSGPRKKREQRRQKITADELARKSQEDGSCSSSRSEEEQSSCEKSDDVSKYDSDTDLTQSLEAISKCESISESISPTDDQSDRLTDERSALNPECSKEESLKIYQVKDGAEEDREEKNLEKRNESDDALQTTNKTDLNEDGQLLERNNNNIEKSDSVNEEKEIDTTEGPDAAQSQTSEKNSSDHSKSLLLLDKIRLDDSLACADSQNIVESIALDDLVIEVATESEREGAKGAAGMNIPLDSVNTIEDNIQSESQLDAKSSVAQSQSTHVEICTEKYPVTKKEEVIISEKKNGSVDWDEHNRLRAELGVKQLERTSMRSIPTDVNRIRNSNILQAVLSLVKELDKDSLDIVSTAVQSRLDKLDS